MHKTSILFSALALVLASAGMAFAAEGEALPWGDFALRLLNVAIFLGIIWHFAGAHIKKFFVGRSAGIAQELDDLATQRKLAQEELDSIRLRVSNLEAEYAKFLNEGKAQAERIKENILSEAQKQAAQIVEQAKVSAALHLKAEAEAIRARLADEIVDAMEKSLEKQLGPVEQEKLIEKSLAKVVLQ